MNNQLKTTSDLAIEYLRQLCGAPTTTEKIAAAIGRSPRSVAVVLRDLTHSGAIVLIGRRIGPGGGSAYGVAGDLARSGRNPNQ